MKVTIGTFNLNNLFSRYNFTAEISEVAEEEGVSSEIRYKFAAGDAFKIRAYRGRLVRAKDADETRTVAERIRAMDADVLAVQEVEDLDTLRHFNRAHLGGMYRFSTLLEGNDPRLIDVGLLSRLPLGGVTSWQHAVHPDDPDIPVFGRDLLEVAVLNERRSRILFTLFNNHLKSHYVDFREDSDAAAMAANLRRKRQAEAVAEIVRHRTRPNGRYIVLGDMNDPPDSPWLAPFVADAELNLSNALTDPEETRPAKADTPPPSGPAWTHRYKPSGQPARYELYDQIWLSASLAARRTGAWIGRRTRHGGDGSDHDPAWISLDM